MGEPAPRSAPQANTDGALERRNSRALDKRIDAGLHPSAMVEKPSFITMFFARRLFGKVRFGRRGIDHIRDVASHSTVVYAIQTRSLLDYLYFNFAFILNGLPLAKFSNGVRTLLFRPLWTWVRFLFRRFPKKIEVFDSVVRAGRTSLIFLERPKREEYQNRVFSQAYVDRLVAHAGRGGTGSVAVIPLLLVWEKRSESYHKSVFDGVFGSRQSPGPVRKFFHLLKNLWQSLWKAGSPHVQVAEAIPLDQFVYEQGKGRRDEIAENLRTQIIDAFERERRVIVGPPIKRASLIRREILESDRVQRAIQREARETREFIPGRVKKRARKIIKEIAADFSLLTLKFLSAFMNAIFDTLYQGFEIDADGLDRLRQTAKDKRVVIVPSHKSHMDYLIVSNVFYQHGLMPPHIAAGVNLSFWPLGPIFRRAGAFFIRRTFKGDQLYSVIFTEYLIKVLDEGYPVEFFIEGTRSRTGKLSRPRYGMLSMMLQAVTDRRLEGLAIVPVSVGYERIVEGQSHQKELLGDEKQGENLSGVLKATRVLRSKYGRVYVEFSDPIDVDQFARTQALDDIVDRDEFERATRRLAYQVIHRINQCTTVTPAAVAATVLLNNPERETSQEQLVAESGFLVNYLLAKGARLSTSLAGRIEAHREILGTRAEGTTGDASDAESPAESAPAPEVRSDPDMGEALREVTVEAMRLFEDSGHLKIRGGDTSPPVFEVEDRHRLTLSYYRNNIVHFFIPEAILASALFTLSGKRVDMAALESRCQMLSRLFKYEFCFAPRSSFDAAFGAALDVFVEMGWVTVDLDNRLVRRPETPAAGAEFLRGLLLHCLESYWLVFDRLSDLVAEPMEQKDFIKVCFRRGRQLYLDDQLLYFESLSKPTFQNVLAWLTERGVVETVADEGSSRRSSDQLLKLTEAFAQGGRWRTLSEELEVFLAKQERSGAAPLRATDVAEAVG